MVLIFFGFEDLMAYCFQCQNIFIFGFCNSNNVYFLKLNHLCFLDFCLFAFDWFDI